MDEGWDDSTEELVTEIFMLAGDTSRTLSEMHYRIAILWSKVRPKTFLKLVNAISLPNTDLTVIQRSEPELGLNVDEERTEITCLGLLNSMAQMKTQSSWGP